MVKKRLPILKLHKFNKTTVLTFKQPFRRAYKRYTSGSILSVSKSDKNGTWEDAIEYCKAFPNGRAFLLPLNIVAELSSCG